MITNFHDLATVQALGATAQQNKAYTEEEAEATGAVGTKWELCSGDWSIHHGGKQLP